MTEKINILNIKIDNIDLKTARQKINQFIKNNRVPGYMIVTPNSEMLVRAQTDYQLTRILNQADLAVADGSGLVLASRILKKPLPERVAGFDLMKSIFPLAEKEKYKIYLLGAKPGVVEKAKTELVTKYPDINICGINHGYLDSKIKKQVIDEINRLKPDLLFVGMGVPKQEKFLDDNLDQLQVKVAMTVGGGFDVLAGKVKRAPRWIQTIYLEWFYRLLKEPSRWLRVLALPKFVFLVLLQTLEKKWGKDEF